MCCAGVIRYAGGTDLVMLRRIVIPTRILCRGSIFLSVSSHCRTLIGAGDMTPTRLLQRFARAHLGYEAWVPEMTLMTSEAMKSHARTAFALLGGAAVLVLAVGCGGSGTGGSTSTTPTTTSPSLSLTTGTPTVTTTATSIPGGPTGGGGPGGGGGTIPGVGGGGGGPGGGGGCVNGVGCAGS
jgi:hypothetical protein